MSRASLPQESIKAMADAAQKAVSALEDPAQPDILKKFKLDPLQVISDFGGPVDELDQEGRKELGGALAKLNIPDAPEPHLLSRIHWGCIGCETALNVIIVGGGGVAAIVTAAAAGPEALAGAAVVILLANWVGVAADAMAGIIIATLAGLAVVTAEALALGLCEAVDLCG